MRHLLHLIRRLRDRPRYAAVARPVDVDALIVWRREQNESVRIVYPEDS